MYSLSNPKARNICKLNPIVVVTLFWEVNCFAICSITH